MSENISSFAEASGKYRLGFSGTCDVDGATTANAQLTVTSTGATNLTASCTGSVLTGSADFDPPTQAELKTVQVTYGSSTASNTILLCPKNYLAVPAAIIPVPVTKRIYYGRRGLEVALQLWQQPAHLFLLMTTTDM